MGNVTSTALIGQDSSASFHPRLYLAPPPRIATPSDVDQFVHLGKMAKRLYAYLHHIHITRIREHQGRYFRLGYDTAADRLNASPAAVRLATDELRGWKRIRQGGKDGKGCKTTRQHVAPALISTLQTGRSLSWGLLEVDVDNFIAGKGLVALGDGSGSTRITPLMVCTDVKQQHGYADVDTKETQPELKPTRNTDKMVITLESAAQHPLLTSQELEGANTVIGRGRGPVEQLMDLGYAPRTLAAWRELYRWTADHGVEGLEEMAEYLRLRGAANPGGYAAALIQRGEDVRTALEGLKARNRVPIYQDRDNEVADAAVGSTVAHRQSTWSSAAAGG